MNCIRLVLPLATALALAAAGTAGAATPKGAVISNGTVSLGVNATGELNYDCPAAEDTGCPAPSLSDDTSGVVGLRYVPLNADGTGPGCACEGWGVADAKSGLTGYANRSETGEEPVNVTPVSFVASPDGRSAVATVDVADPERPGYGVRVVHHYRPSLRSPNVYEAAVSVTNTGSNPIEDLRYRRAMDWDVEPTAFDEWTTMRGRTPQLLFNSDDGFASSDPLAGPSYIHSETVCGAAYTGPCEYTDLGEGGVYPEITTPDDVGALFDFGFAGLAVGETQRFTVLYGAAPSEEAATAALAAAGAEIYSLGEPSCPTETPDGADPETGADATGCAGAEANSGVERGTPVTFMFGFVTTRADVSMEKTDSADPVRAGDTFSYTLKASNDGPDTAGGVQVRDELPAGVEFVSATPSQGQCAGERSLVCELGPIPAGGSATVTVVVRAVTPGEVVNAATVTAASDDPRPENNTGTATTRVDPVPPPPEVRPQPPLIVEPQPPVVSPILECTRKKIVLIDVLQDKGRVKLLGAADPDLAGKPVDLIFTGNGKRAARATVRADGTFETTAPLPPRRIRTTNRARYQAVIGKERSDRLKLFRRVAVTGLSSAGGNVTIRGRLIRPLAKPIRPISVYQRVSCTKTKVVKTFRPSKSGAFEVTFKAPAGQASAVYVLRTQVRKTLRSRRPFLTKSLPRPVVIR